MATLKPFAFVLMPFEKKFDDVYKYGIKSIGESLGIVVERVDEQNFSETMLERIYRQIEVADFIIAEMTGRNANVFYEVGYAHAKGKLCALITQDASDIPFDLKHHKHIVYNGSASDLSVRLSQELSWIAAESQKRKSEIISIEVQCESGFLDKTEFSHTGTLEMFINLKNKTDRRSPEIEAVYITCTSRWELRHNGEICPSEISGKSGAMKRHLVAPKIRRIAPGAFAQERVQWKRTLWTKYSGEVAKDEYPIKGNLRIELVTSEGTIPVDVALDTKFDEIPF